MELVNQDNLGCNYRLPLSTVLDSPVGENKVEEFTQYYVLVAYSRGIEQSLVGLSFPNPPPTGGRIEAIGLDEISNWGDATVVHRVVHEKETIVDYYMRNDEKISGWNQSESITVDKLQRFVFYNSPAVEYPPIVFGFLTILTYTCI